MTLNISHHAMIQSSGFSYPHTVKKTESSRELNETAVHLYDEIKEWGQKQE